MRLPAFALGLLSAMAALPAASKEPTCHQNDAYLVAEQENDDYVGSHFTVSLKTSPAAAKTCRFNLKTAWMKIGEGGEPLHFDSLKGHHLILWESTGPQGYVRIYDLKAKREMLDAPAEDMTVSDKGVIFWRRIADGTAQNCRIFAKNETRGMSSTIVRKERYDFTTGKLTQFSQTRCVTTQ